MAYEEQLEAKTHRLPELADGVVPSPAERQYRNRSKYVVASNEKGLYLGAYRPRSHDVEQTIGCPVVEPEVDRAAKALEDVLRSADLPVSDPERKTGLCRARRRAGGGYRWRSRRWSPGFPELLPADDFQCVPEQ